MTIEEELTYVARTAVLEPQLLKGETARNKITDLGNGYLLKEYKNPEQGRTELVAGQLFEECLARGGQGRVGDSVFVPRITNVNASCDVGGSAWTNLIEKIDGYVPAYELLNSGDYERGEVLAAVNELVSLFIATVKENYTKVVGRTDQGITETYCSFNTQVWPRNFMDKVATVYLQFKLRKDYLSALIGEDFARNVVRAFKTIADNCDTSSHWTLLHRDLHLSNLLLSPDLCSMAVIDFEHALVGPLEYEFQNSIVFNDDKSLEVGAIIDGFNVQSVGLLPQFGQLFLAEQMVQMYS